MTLALSATMALEFGTSRTTATLQDPIVRVEDGGGDDAARVVIDEGGVSIALEFPDRDAVVRFERRLAGGLAAMRRRRP